MGPFTLNTFTDWPFNGCQISAGAYIEHMLGARYYIQFYGKYKASERLLSLDREIRYAEEKKITSTCGIIIFFKNSLSIEEMQRQEDISMGSYLADFSVFKVSFYLANNSLLT